MPWVVGIDEAGLGPNLGPLVQSAIAARVPDGVDCLWKCLAGGVRRAGEPDDGRLLIDDSKLVNVGPHGLSRLERGVVGVVADCRPVGEFLGGMVCGSSLADLAEESWFDAAEPLPVALEPEVAVQRPLADALDFAAVELKLARCVVTPAPKFNRLIDRWGSKAGAMEQGVSTLLQTVLAGIDDTDAITIVIDKQGGRNFYAPWFSAAIPDAWIAPVRESAAVSEYQVLGLARDVRLLIYPRAESEALPVALASMLSKYLREVCMRQFNRFWIGHVPGLKPTSGYHTDSRQYYRAIRPAMRNLGLKPSAVWRKK
jgi:hypothetical protein